MLPACASEVYLTKEVTPEVEKGEEIEVQLQVINYGDSSNASISLSDIIPDGCSYVDGSASLAPTNVSSDLIEFELPALGADESRYHPHTGPPQPAQERRRED